MSNALAPLVITSLFAAISGIFPAFITWRFLKNERDVPVTRQETIINYSIIACLTVLHICEAMKSIYFGLEYNGYSMVIGTITRVTLKTLIDFLSEAGHILIIGVVLQRMVALIAPPKQFTDEQHSDVHTNFSYVIMIFRLATPLLAILMKARVNAFGLYQFVILIFELAVLIYATVTVTMFLRKISREENLGVPKWQLYSNPIVTGTIAALAFLMIILNGAFYDSQYEDGNIVTDQNSVPVILPSFYALFVGLFFVIYQDTKVILQEARSPSRNGSQSARRVKFTMASILA